jgi:hypothetical protein
VGVRARWSRGGGSCGGSGEPETGEDVADGDESTAAAGEREGPGFGPLLSSFRRLRGREGSPSSAGVTVLALVSLLPFFRCFSFRA